MVSDREFKGFVRRFHGETGPLIQQYADDLELLLRNGLLKESVQFVKWAQHYEKLNETEVDVFKLIESILYYRQGDFFRSFVQFRRNFDDYRRFRLPRFLMGLSSPVRYRSLIEAYSEENELDSRLVMALIRQESFFRPGVVSPARANGLMQILYRTGRYVASGQNLRIKKADLFNPEINIRLGTRYLKTLLNRYDGKIHLALASYNAGEHRVDGWLKSFGDVSDEQFIEMIPFTETRNYVKTILRNYYYYRFYYGFDENVPIGRGSGRGS